MWRRETGSTSYQVMVSWHFNAKPSLITRFMGPTWGPSGADRTQVGHMLAPLTLLSGFTWIDADFFENWPSVKWTNFSKIRIKTQKQFLSQMPLNCIWQTVGNFIQASIHYVVRRITTKICEESRPRDGCYNDQIALKCDRDLGNGAAEVPVKFHNDWNSLIPNFYGFESSGVLALRRPSVRLVNREGTRSQCIQ